MWRTWVIVIAFFGSPAGLGCDEGTGAKAKDTAKKATRKVDQAVDKFEASDANEHLDRAKADLANGTEPAEHCSWVVRETDTDATKPALDELRKLCALDVPLLKATQAVVRAEKARAEVPDAPSLTECQSDDWANTKKAIDASPHASDAKWTDLKTRWAKVCPDQK